MAKKGLVGTIACPYLTACGNQQAEVRRDKNGNLYIVCYECEPVSQHFTRGSPQRIKALGLTAFVEEPAAPPPAPEPAPAQKPAKDAPKEKKGGSVWDGLPR